MLGHYLSAYSPAASARQLYDPDGNVVTTPGTQTAGVNEGIALAVASGFAFKCEPKEQILCGTYLDIPPCLNADIDLGSTNFAFNASGVMVMNTFNGGRFFHSGVMFYMGPAAPGAALQWIDPNLPDPVYGQKIIQNADIQFGQIVNAGGAVEACTQLNLTTGSIYNNKRLEWLNLQGWNGAANIINYGIKVVPKPIADPYTGFNENNIVIGQIIGFVESGVLVGNGSPNDNFMGDNQWTVGINPTGLTSGPPIPSMFDTYASYDRIQGGMTIYTGTCPHSIRFLGTANYNKYALRQDTSSSGVLNNGLSNTAA